MKTIESFVNRHPAITMTIAMTICVLSESIVDLIAGWIFL